MALGSYNILKTSFFDLASCLRVSYLCATLPVVGYCILERAARLGMPRHKNYAYREL